MSEEKRMIEELADFLWRNTIIHTEDFCHDVAETIITADYRKQSEGEWIFEHEYYGKMLCSNCNGEALVNECSEYIDSDFCPNCGARMGGGAE